MKKSLLIAVAALFVAIGVNAQFKAMPKNPRSVQYATKVTQPMATHSMLEKSDVAVKKHVNDKNMRRAVADVEGTYILNYDNFDGDFTASSSFTITAESGTTMVTNVETDADDIEFSYNVRLDNFSLEGAVVYGLYDEKEGTILIPAQCIANEDGYGRVILSGVTKDASGSPKSPGFDIVLEVDAEGYVTFYDFAQELDEAGFTGQYMSGWYSYLPDYEEGGAWNYGFDVEIYFANNNMYANECHVGSAGWSAWEWKKYPIYVEDYGSEIVVHNFLGKIPLSMTVNGDQCEITLPVQIYDYSHDTYGIAQIWTLDETDPTGNTLTCDGKIVGNVFQDENGTGYRFYDTEWRDAWTDESGEHEAGNYFVNTKWFFLGALNSEGYGVWGVGGEYRYVDFYFSSETSGISNVKNENKVGASKTYNLMGQQVSAGTKGLVIRDGKKYINK